ncbi:PAS domain-containing protein [Altererythrobacter aurantiacus]|uniref:histidine kinase n=1 Tax=Parapontixanthobacter aurantiacus TaxID=1463599 RepID=A0A844ZHR1_9SPHN|nr:PAS domain-containing protein [Parapontixanthobacter aurantiacus]MXO86666.1 PAS domain-containing protein [Parapontixanthobacter aurantiacus]
MLNETLLPWPQGKAPDPEQTVEAKRKAVLELYGLDALEDDPELVQITHFTARLCGAPICLVSLVEEERQRFLAREGLEENETPRPTSFCAHAMLLSDVMVVPDAREDERFETNPLVTGHPHIRFYAGAPLISHEGAPLGSLCVIDTEPRPQGLTDLQKEGLLVMAASVMRRLRHRREALAQQAELKRSEKQLQTLADSIPDIAWSARPDGSFDYFNQRWYDFIGLSDKTRHVPRHDLFHPDDKHAWLDKWEEARREAQPYETEYRLKRADGEYRWMLVRGVPVYNSAGHAERWFGTLTDIDASKRESDQRDLLARELSHRIKNIFAVISGLIALRTRGRDDLGDFAGELTGTIKSLGRAHDYVNPVAGRKGDSLRELLTDLLAPYESAGEPAIVFASEEDLPIGPEAATPLALIFHELATNSAKYGALSNEGGKVTLDVRGAEDDDVEGMTIGREDAVVLRWSEPGIAPGGAEDNPREGFGSRLLRTSVEGQLRGRMTRIFDENGLDVKLVLPAASIAPK